VDTGLATWTLQTFDRPTTSRLSFHVVTSRIFSLQSLLHAWRGLAPDISLKRVVGVSAALLINHRIFPKTFRFTDVMSGPNNYAPIPSYEEAVMAAPTTRSLHSSGSSQASQSPVEWERRDSADSCIQSSSPPFELPPAYAVVDEKATTFTIYGTMIHTPNAPAYQLSSFLDSQVDTLKLRRLRAEEVTLLQSGAHTLPFDHRSALYKAHDPPFLSNDYYVEGQHRSTLPGLLHMSFGIRRWHVAHIPIQNGRPVALMTCGKSGGLKKTIKHRKNEMEPSVWKDNDGNVMATEIMKVCHGGKMPTIELRPDLDQTCRELILALWVSRLWIAFGRKAQTT